jgi:hypothetical protein
MAASFRVMLTPVQVRGLRELSLPHKAPTVIRSIACFRNSVMGQTLHAAFSHSIGRRTGNLRAVRLLLGHTKIESTARYLGIEVDEALAIAEQVDV